MTLAIDLQSQRESLLSTIPQSTQTLMQGANYCDFRWHRKPSET